MIETRKTEINNISDITLTGNINNEDIIVLRNMVQNGSLEYVDMFDSYIHGEGDEDNVIPEEAFKNCTNLKSIILPQKTLALGYESFLVSIYNHRTTKTNQKYPSVNL